MHRDYFNVWPAQGETHRPGPRSRMRGFLSVRQVIERCRVTGPFFISWVLLLRATFMVVPQHQIMVSTNPMMPSACGTRASTEHIALIVLWHRPFMLVSRECPMI